MIKYHGGPITPNEAAIAAWRDGHAMISFANPQQVKLAFEYAAEVAIDNGAYSLWGRGQRVDVAAYLDFLNLWRKHPAFGWCIIPDTIDGSEEENCKLIQDWTLDNYISVPVWHMHESLDMLGWLVDEWPRVAIGSSGEFADPATQRWWTRIAEAMEVACDSDGYPKTRLHGLRQMDNEITSHMPYASVDSCNIARNIGIDAKWTGAMAPDSKDLRALIMRDRISKHAVAARWTGFGGFQRNMELYG